MTPSEWLFRPGWRSIFTYPFALWCILGMAWGVAWGLTAEWDLIRWNFIFWLILGWNLGAFWFALPVGAYWLALTSCAMLWTADNMQRWWALPIKVIATLLIPPLANLIFVLGTFGVAEFVEGATTARFESARWVFQLMSDMGWWATIAKD